jgi:hypothetical protein
MVRRLLIASATAVVAGVLGSPAFAAGSPAQRPGGLPHSVASAHFKVWYDSDSTQQDYITQTQATTLAGMAEHALTVFTGWGYQAPVDDGDGLTDIYVLDFTPWPGVAGVAIADGGAAPSSGSIDMAQSVIGSDWEQHAIAHELFHLIQYRYWLPATLGEHWLLEGSAEWAGYKLDNYTLAAEGLGPPELSLDCFDSAGLDACSPDGYVNGGYSRWWFYEYLTQKYGNAFVKDVLQQAQTANSALTGLDAALTAKGSSLASAFGDFAIREMTGGWGLKEIDALVPTAAATVVTGVETADLGSLSIGVDHLASRYIGFTRGDGLGDHPCYAATLTITVTIPNGVSTTPSFFWNAKGSSAVALSVSGQTATATVPWDTCYWPANEGFLSLANPSTTVDAAVFTVATKVTVDTNTPAAAVTPPEQAPLYGGQTDVANADIPPAVTLFGSLRLRIPRSNPVLHLAVEASSDGKLQATLDNLSLGTATLRAGMNDLAFTVPKTLLVSLRRSLAVSGVLTLTVQSPSGAVTGATITRSVVLSSPAPKAKAKAKPKKP